jgi:hypothetical protein
LNCEPRHVDRLGLAAVVEGQVGVLEELPLPLAEEGGVDLELIRAEMAVPSTRWRLTMAAFS